MSDESVGDPPTLEIEVLDKVGISDERFAYLLGQAAALTKTPLTSIKLAILATNAKGFLINLVIK